MCVITTVFYVGDVPKITKIAELVMSLTPYREIIKRRGRMNNRIFKLALTSFVATMVTATSMTSAIAAPEKDANSTFSTPINKAVEKELPKTEKELPNKTEVNKEESFKPAKIQVHNGDKTQTIEIDDSETTISDALKERDLNVSDYRTSENQALDGNQKLHSGQSLESFKTSVSSTYETIVLPRQETVKETDALFVGETQVESEGKDGEAIKTITTTSSQATDKNVNKDSSSPEVITSVEEKLTVVSSPEPRIILVGIKPIPAPVVEEEVFETYENIEESTESYEEINEILSRSSENDVAESESSSVQSPSVTPSRNSNDNSSVVRNQSSNGDVSKVSRNPVVPEAVRSSSASSNKIGGVLDFTYNQVGKAYRWASAGPNAYDCSGLVYAAFQKQGINVPRTAAAQGRSSTPVAIKNLQPGDILWTNSHIGIYIGDNKMIHASTPATGVKESDIGWFLKAGAKGGRLA